MNAYRIYLSVYTISIQISRTGNSLQTTMTDFSGSATRFTGPLLQLSILLRSDVQD